MKPAQQFKPSNEYEAWLQEFDERDLDSPRPASMWALKYRARLHAVTRLLKRYVPPGETVLEVGSSQANVSLLAAEAGYRAVALDRELRALVYARRKYEQGVFFPLVGDALCLPLRDERFSGVLALEILEHLPDPPAALAEMTRVLAPGGLLVATTPNADYVGERLPSYHQAEIAAAGRSEADAAGHLFAFTRCELIELIISAGLSVVHHGYVGSIVMSERWRPGGWPGERMTNGLSSVANHLPGARWVSYNCVVAARKP
jgi:SAM-dependent methyltransferase